MTKAGRIDPLVHYSRKVRELESLLAVATNELQALTEDRDRWKVAAKWLAQDAASRSVSDMSDDRKVETLLGMALSITSSDLYKSDPHFFKGGDNDAA